MKFINCTPHPLQVLNDQNEVINSFPKGEVVPRLKQQTEKMDVVGGIQLTKTVFGETTDLPEQEEGVMLIVSRLILSANPNRSDLVVPNEIVRDDEGKIIGCRSLAIN